MSGDDVLILEVCDLVKEYNGKAVVDQVSFSLMPGESYGLLGPNGAGKSTTIGMIFGLIRPSQGSIRVNGISVREKPLECKKLLGYVPQDIALYGDLSARENLMFWGRMYDLSGKKLSLRVQEALETVGLADRAKDKVETFSGGMKRRVNIAAALLHEPQILIMDEPTVGIDPQSRSYILETVKSLNCQGMTIIYTSHYMEEVEFLCHRIGIIDYGKVIAEGTLEKLRAIIGEAGQIYFSLKGKLDGILPDVEKLEGVMAAHLQDTQLVVTSLDPAQALAKTAGILSARGIGLQKVEIKEANLEAVFLHLTGRALRD